MPAIIASAAAVRTAPLPWRGTQALPANLPTAAATTPGPGAGTGDFTYIGRLRVGTDNTGGSIFGWHGDEVAAGNDLAKAVAAARDLAAKDGGSEVVVRNRKLGQFVIEPAGTYSGDGFDLSPVGDQQVQFSRSAHASTVQAIVDSERYIDARPTPAPLV